MTQGAENKDTGKRMYAVEILRTLFILGIVFDHLSKQICQASQVITKQYFAQADTGCGLVLKDFLS